MAKINKPSIATDTSLLVVGHNRGVGFSEKVNYNSETREQVIKLVLKGEKSANQIAKELGIGPNTVGRWVNEYRKEHNLPSYREERRIRKVSVEELAAKNRELEKLLKKREKELADEKETVEILKKSLHIFDAYGVRGCARS
ncbi:MAG: transposase [Fibrobacteraceae bacterium]|nr:transposase [Fibrobacteraceae bacterium]